MPKENKSIFIDSNVWIYAFIQQQDKYKAETAKNLIAQRHIAISTQVINEVCANLKRKTNPSEDMLSELINSFYRRYMCLTPEQNTLLSASQLRREYMLSFWDSLIIASALQLNAGILYSEDMQHGLIVRNKLRLINPFKATY
jgi:predicted nucleic acid-binding protein